MHLCTYCVFLCQSLVPRCPAFVSSRSIRLHRLQHSKQTHLYALLKAAKEYGVPKVFIHFFGDGRDTDPKSGADYMQELVENLQEIGIGEIATVVGRYWAMDRDKRWDRLEIALKGLIQGEGEDSEDPVATVRARYERGGDKDRDEFLTPIIVGGDERRIKGKTSIRSVQDDGRN